MIYDIIDKYKIRKEEIQYESYRGKQQTAVIPSV